MEIPQILAELERARGYFPAEAVAAAVARREEIVPHLLRVLEETLAHAEESAAEGQGPDHYLAHEFALYLLAQFREPRGLPLALRFACLPQAWQEALLSDSLDEEFPRLLASLCGRDLGPLTALIEDENALGAARAAALQALVILVAAGGLPRQDIVTYFARLLRGGLRREPSAAWDALASSVQAIHPAGLIDDLRQAYDEGLGTDWGMDDWETVAELEAVPIREVLEETRVSHGRLIEDAAAEMRWWACFEPAADLGGWASAQRAWDHHGARGALGQPIRWPDDEAEPSQPGSA